METKEQKIERLKKEIKLLKTKINSRAWGTSSFRNFVEKKFVLEQ